MELPIEQLSKILQSAQRILLTGPANPNIDVVSSAMAWRLFLQRKNKQVDLAFAGQVPDLKFLPKVDIDSQLENLGNFKIILRVGDNKVKQLSYDVKGDNLEINIVPESGSFNDADVTTKYEGYKYDLVIMLGAMSLDSLGEIFSQNKNFFWQTPIINIDRSLLNENFGQLNIIETSTTSLAEISFRLLKNGLDKNISTALLTGMIAATNSFQAPQVTPDTLALASQLIVKGADRQSIVQGLYRTKDIATLKNWGRVLSRLRKSGNIITSFLKHDEGDNLPQDWQELVKDLILASPQTQAVVIFYQVELNKTEAWIYAVSNINVLELTKNMKPEGYRQFAKIIIEQDLDSARELLIEKIQEKLNLINQAE